MEKIIVISEIQPPQNDKERKTRERVTCFLKHPKEEKFALIQEKYGITIPWWWIEKDETLEEAIKREIREEIWYLHIKTIKNLNLTIQLERYMTEQDCNLHSLSHFFSLNCLILNSKHENLALFGKKKRIYYQKSRYKQLKLHGKDF